MNRLRRALSIFATVALLAWSSFASAAAPTESSTPARQKPRFLVVDFASADGKDQTSWIALAVSEGLRFRLRRSGATTAVSDMRTSGVMERRFRETSPPIQDVLPLAKDIGADWAVAGSLKTNDRRTFDLDLQVAPTRSTDRSYRKVIQGASARTLMDEATRAVLESAGVSLTDDQIKRLAAMPGGTDSAIEYYAKALRAVRAGKANDALYYVAQSRHYDPKFRPTTALLGQVNLTAGNHREVLLIYEQLLREAKRDGDPVDEVFALTQIAIAHQRDGDLPVAEMYYRAGLKLARQIGLTDLQAVLYGALATLRVDQHKRADALGLLNQRLSLLQAEGDRLAMGPACLTIALVYEAEGDSAKAFDYLNRAAALAEEVNQPSDRAAAVFQIAELHKQKGELEQALRAYRESLKYSPPSEAGSAYREIAGIYEKQGKDNKALEMLHKAQTILAERKAYAQQANCLARIARIYARRNEFRQAADTMGEAIEILRDLGHPELAKYERELSDLRAKAGSR